MPYDVLRMRKAMGLSSGEFLEKYTIALLTPEGLPVVVLKMKEDKNKTCPFVTSDGCKIYHDRPWSCRMYPVFSSSEGGFSINAGSTCLGCGENKLWTIEGWMKDQGIDIYDKMNEFYEKVTLHNFFLKGNKLDPEKSKMLHMACYDLDKFKRFLYETRFFVFNDLKEEIYNTLEEDDEELLIFGYKWVRFDLFEEHTIRF